MNGQNRNLSIFAVVILLILVLAILGFSLYSLTNESDSVKSQVMTPYSADVVQSGDGKITIRSSFKSGSDVNDSEETTSVNTTIPTNPTNSTNSTNTNVPFIRINSPVAGTYNISNVLINITVLNNTGGLVWYNNGTNAANSTYTSPVTLNYPNGSYTLRVWANNSLNNITSASVIFSVNTSATAPTINTAPVLSLPAVIGFDEDKSFSLNLSDYVADAEDADSAIVWTVSGNTNVNVAIGANKVANISAAANWNGLEMVTFRATDSGGLYSEQRIPVTVNPIDDNSYWTAALANKSIMEDSPAGTVVYAGITSLTRDAEGDPISFTVNPFTAPYTLSIVGSDLVVNGLQTGNWYGNRTISISLNSGATASFNLEVKQKLDECFVIGGRTFCD